MENRLQPTPLNQTQLLTWRRLQRPIWNILASKASSHSTDSDIPATLFNRQASTLDSNRSMVPTPDQSQRKRFCRSSSSSEGQSVPPAHSHIADDQSLPIEFHLPQPTAANIYPSTDGSPLLIHIRNRKLMLEVPLPTGLLLRPMTNSCRLSTLI